MLSAIWYGEASIVFDANGSNGTMKPDSYTVNQKYPLPPCSFTEPEWHDFIGWQVNDDAQNLKQPLETVTIAGDTVVLKARWLQSRYTVTFNTNSGTAVDAQTLLKVEIVQWPANPFREGFTFRGWYQLMGDTVSESVFDFSTPVTGHITPEARWIAVYDTPDFTLLAGVALIEEYVFQGISAHIVYIPDSCREIGVYAFKGCANLSRIHIPAGCAIGEFVFDGCEKVYIFGTAGCGAEQYCQYHDNCEFVAE